MRILLSFFVLLFTCSFALSQSAMQAELKALESQYFSTRLPLDRVALVDAFEAKHSGQITEASIISRLAYIRVDALSRTDRYDDTIEAALRLVDITPASSSSKNYALTAIENAYLKKNEIELALEYNEKCIQNSIDLGTTAELHYAKGRKYQLLEAQNPVTAKAYFDSLVPTFNEQKWSARNIYRVFNARYTSLVAANASSDAINEIIDLAITFPEAAAVTDQKFVLLKFDRLVAKGKIPEGIALLKSYPTTHKNALAQLKYATSDEEKDTIFAKWIDEDAVAFNKTKYSSFSTFVADGDSAKLLSSDAQSVLENTKMHIRRTTGLINNEQLVEFSKQLQTGDGIKLLTVSDRSKAVSAKLAQAKTPIGQFMHHYLKGDYVEASKLAFNNARNSKSDSEYKFWIMFLSGVVRTNDQCYNVRAIETVKWINGEIQACPIENLIGPQ